MVAAKRLDGLVIDAWTKLENKEDCELIAVVIVDCIFYQFVNLLTWSQLKGMCLSGAGSPDADTRLYECFSKLNVAYNIHIANDCLAPIYTAFKNGMFRFP